MPIGTLDPLGLQERNRRKKKADSASERGYTESGMEAADSWISGWLSIIGLDVAKNGYEYVSAENFVTGDDLTREEQAAKGADVAGGLIVLPFGLVGDVASDANKIRKLAGTEGFRLTRKQVEELTKRRLEKKLGRKLITIDKGHDYIDPVSKTRYDQIGSPMMISCWEEQRDNFFEALEDHVKNPHKTDVTVIDLTGFPDDIRAEIGDWMTKYFGDADFDRLEVIGF